MQDTKNRPRKRLYESRWFRISMISFGIVGLVFFEGFQYYFGDQGDPEATQWIMSAVIVKKAVGEIKSLERVRPFSKTTFEFGGPRRGRLHYLVHGTHTDVDLLVSWHQGDKDAKPVVDKVQWIDTKGFDTIWP